MSARSELRWVKVESTATFTCGWLRRRSVRRVHRIGCISAMLEPHSTKASAASKIVIAAHRLVHAERAHEGDRRRRHAVAGIWVEIVRAKARPHQLGGGVAFEDGPLPGAEHAERARPLRFQ